MTILFGGGDVSKAIEKKLLNNDEEYVSIGHSKHMIEKLTNILIINKDIDRVIITAGYLEKHANGAYTEKSIDKIIDANITIPIKVINLVLLYREKAKIIVFSSSVTHDIHRRFYDVYAAAKAGLERFVLGCINNNDANIKIIRPSRMNTKLRWSNYNKNDFTTLDLTEPNEIVDLILNFINSDKIILNFKKIKNKIETKEE